MLISNKILRSGSVVRDAIFSLREFKDAIIWYVAATTNFAMFVEPTGLMSTMSARPDPTLLLSIFEVIQSLGRGVAKMEATSFRHWASRAFSFGSCCNYSIIFCGNWCCNNPGISVWSLCHNRGDVLAAGLPGMCAMSFSVDRWCGDRFFRFDMLWFVHRLSDSEVVLEDSGVCFVSIQNGEQWERFRV